MKKIIAFFRALHWQGIVPHFPNWGEEKWVFGPEAEKETQKWWVYERRVCQHPGCFRTFPIERWEKSTNEEVWVRQYPLPKITKKYPLDK